MKKIKKIKTEIIDKQIYHLRSQIFYNFTYFHI